MQLDTITELLQIPGFKVTHMLSSTESSREFLLEREEERASVCSGCGKVHNTAVHSEGRVLVEDLPISGKRVYLHVPKRKSVCLEDGSIRVEELEWIRGRFTKRFVEQVYRSTSITTNKEAGWFLGIDDETVYRLGIDKETEYIFIAKQRIKDFYNGRLKIRPMGKPVFEPTGREKVSQIPSEWKQKEK